MKKFPIYLLMAGVVISLTTLFAACSEDDETKDEWSSTYAYIASNYFLRPTSAFVIDHTREGEITGTENVVIPFSIRLNRAAEKDVTVGIKIISDNIPAEAIQLTSNQLDIRKGEYESVEDTVSIPDWAFAKQNEEKTNYRFSIAINVNGGAYFTLSSNKSKADFEVLKNARCKMELKEPEDAYLWQAKGGWTFAFQEGVENAGSNSVAGTGSNDVATNGVPFWVTIDLNDVFIVKGIQSKHWGGSYAPSQIEMLYSEDGENWKSMGVLVTNGGTQKIAFTAPVETRYLKYQMMTVPGRVDLTGLYVYVDRKPTKMTFQGTTSLGGTDIDKTNWNVECATPPYSDPYTLEGFWDGNNKTAYFAQAGKSPININMKALHLVKGVSVTGSSIYYDANYSLKEMQILTSTNGETWTDLYSVTLDQAPDGVTPQYILFDKPVNAQYIRIMALEAYNGFFGVSDFHIYE